MDTEAQGTDNSDMMRCSASIGRISSRHPVVDMFWVMIWLYWEERPAHLPPSRPFLALVTSSGQEEHLRDCPYSTQSGWNQVGNEFWTLGVKRP